ncbi:Chromosome II, complete genome, related [Eimeria necatrix]|uniref:Chromosome II, complete genome, related n=1 Tax=Eimeria necatrix TaxID=51315 RepID=U6MEI2_9EIME|nr:Chromosome II, complete genome, related [Eimeria necatrix]CDJ62436.1 Chromosome II, complete genome, related [Eimeria necatrix]
MLPCLLGRACAQPAALPLNSAAARLGKCSFSPFAISDIRFIATHSPHLHIPSPPPREFEPDGSPKVYRLTQTTYNHKYDWQRWYLAPVGVFHTVYKGQFARDSPAHYAWLLQHNMIVASVPLLLFSLTVAFMITTFSLVGIRPKRFTLEWMLANKERERAENSNPMTRYLDRRRKERGSNWLPEKYLLTHPFLSVKSETPAADAAAKE